MKSILVLVAVLGCTKAEPTPAPLPPPAPLDAAVPVVPPAPSDASARSASVLRQPWPELAGGTFDSFVLAGPYPTLEAACKDIVADDCASSGASDAEDPEHRILAIDELRTHHALGPEPPDHTLDQRRHAAFQTSRGWWVSPYVEGMGGGRGGYGTTDAFVDGHLVLASHLTKATSGKWEGHESEAIAVCAAADDESVRCTPRAITARWTYHTDRRADPGGRLEAELSCIASFAKGAVTTSPAKRPAPGDGTAWSTRAALACKALPYAGTRPTKLR